VESHTTTWWLPKDTFVDFLNSHPGIALRLKMEMGYEIEGYESEEDLIHP
jgi:CRP-like cAMP-binding protein